MSFGNTKTEFQLDKNDIAVLVGSNGNGKSSILDAICFGLFGRAFRNINKPQLVNSINQKDCVVEIEFTTNGNKYRVVRGLKPAVFEIYCNHVMVDQNSKIKDYQEYFEANILKMNFKTFTQVVILGTAAYTPFMELTAANRRGVVEDLLDIQIFSTMNDIVKEKLAALKDQYNSNDYEINLSKEKIKLIQSHIDDMKKKSELNIGLIMQSIEESKKSLAIIQSNIFNLNTVVAPLPFLLENQEKILKNITTLREHEKTFNKKLAGLSSDLAFYNKHDKCPTCNQNITDDHKHTTVTEKNTNKNQLETTLAALNRDVAKLKEEYDEYNSKVTTIMAKKAELAGKKAEESAMLHTIATLEHQKDNIVTGSISDTESVTKIKDEQTKLGSLEQERKRILDEQNHHSIMATLLKDNGIKATVVKQYLPVMNKLINKYLGDLDFHIDFNLTENFSENIKSRHRADFTYSSFSEGEKFKINLALLFTWREIAKLRNSSATNLLFLDEVMDSSLDIWGTEAVLKLIHQLKGTNTFIISHKVDILQDKFTNIYVVEKEKGFSKIKK